MTGIIIRIFGFLQVLLAVVAVAFAAEKTENADEKKTEKRGVAGLSYGAPALGLAAAPLAAPAIAAAPIGYGIAPAAIAAPAYGYSGLAYGAGAYGLAAPALKTGLGYAGLSSLAYDVNTVGLGYGLGSAIAAYNGPIVAAAPAVKAYAGPAIAAAPAIGYAAPALSYASPAIAPVGLGYASAAIAPVGLGYAGYGLHGHGLGLASPIAYKG